ncbi:MAG: PilZ domain-containing protein [Polyangia bacterium]
MRNRDSADRAPFPPLEEKRQHLRFDKVFPVRVESILFGELDCVARNVSAGGIFVEMTEPLPLGAHVRVSFLSSDTSAEIVALGEVKNHYFMNFAKEGLTRSVSGMAVRFYAFENESQQILADCLDRFRVLN